MKIGIVGSGNIGLAMAGKFTLEGNEVIVFSSHGGECEKSILYYDHDNERKMQSPYFYETNNIETLLKFSNLIFVTYPAFLFMKLAKEMYPYLKSSHVLVFVPGFGGVEYSFYKAITNKKVSVFGLERVPAVYRLSDNRTVANVMGRRSELRIGHIGTDSRINEVLIKISTLFSMKVINVNNYLNVTLTKSNACLHPARLYSLYKKYGNQTMKTNPLFYKEWDDVASSILLAFDDEVSNIISELNEFDLSEIESLRVHYEGTTPFEITRTISNIDSLSKIGSPVKRVANGWLFDYESRYFKADIPFGLLIYKGIGEILNVKTPIIDHVCDTFIDKIDLFANGKPQSFGIDTREKFVSLYSKMV